MIIIHNDKVIRQSRSRFKRTFFHWAGILASNMQFNASRRFSLMMMVPSIASFSSVRVLRARVSTLCILSISCLRKMFIGWNGPIFCSLSLTCRGDIQHMLKIRHVYATGASKRSQILQLHKLFFFSPLSKNREEEIRKEISLRRPAYFSHPMWEKTGSH